MPAELTSDRFRLLGEPSSFDAVDTVDSGVRRALPGRPARAARTLGLSAIMVMIIIAIIKKSEI